MYLFEYFIMAILFYMLFYEHTAKVALLILMAYQIHHEYIVILDGELFYFCTSLLNLVVGFSLQKENIEAAICSFLLVLSTILGFIMWYLYLEPTLYNSISAIILTIQLFTIFPRGLLNGFIDKHLVGISVFFDSYRARDTMYKNTQQTKENS